MRWIAQILELRHDSEGWYAKIFMDSESRLLDGDIETIYSFGTATGAADSITAAFQEMGTWEKDALLLLHPQTQRQTLSPETLQELRQIAKTGELPPKE